jgi:hypothetical protein
LILAFTDVESTIIAFLVCFERAENMMRNLASLIALTVLFVFMNGCGTFKAYEGPELPDSELATIHGHYCWRFFYGEDDTIRSVDGKYHGYGSEAKVLPGSHWIRFRHVTEYILVHGRYLSCGMDIETKAGHEYHIVPCSLEFEHRPPRLFEQDVIRGSVQIEERLSGSSLGKMRIPTECAWGLICRTDADCIDAKSPCRKQSGFKCGFCSPTPSNP